MKKKFISYLPQINSFGIEASEVAVENGLIRIELCDADYKRFGCKVSDNAPTIGLLMELKDGIYVAHQHCVQALAHAGAKILFLDHEQYLSLLNFCDGLLLPGGNLVMPERYYSDAKPEAEVPSPSSACSAYFDCFMFALVKGMPILGIDDGMHVIAASLGLKLYRSVGYAETPLLHDTPDSLAHHVDLVKDTLFYKLMDEQWRLPVNSRHTRLLAPVRVQHDLSGRKFRSLPLEIYALATDGIPEAIGDMRLGLLGVQWHPESYAVSGERRQQRIFDWLLQKAESYKAAM